ncbi:MAG: NAD-dependent deacylase [Chitinophagales bacterium]|jgi:NAD-dependent deacetylase|nr:NAD-dependent deacylase [Chitinophagales bacterium]MCO5281556.1 NAD-dependent deacylase [Chitinophagales bacterium]OJV29897.1 MAG: NAD-dependent protein deacylase [Bacteroidetes bacterium 37-13]HRN94017.1 Sir2 family NAD-dependent protein deacetylase [Chitinophagales bacterium]HRP39047.1 Sir2 family NAD-dependent protein deacetylase [Chitinophagales bacterium]
MREKPRIVVLTGAGVSEESGIKTFRDSNGLWENHKIEEVASPHAWNRSPYLVLEFYNKRRKEIIKAKPNAAHLALVELEKRFNVVIVTQNIDDLHERAGSSNIIHLHGEILKSRSSIDEELVYDCKTDLCIGDKCKLGSQLRPHIVWFGEAVPKMEDAITEISIADILIIIGTSLQVYPAAGLIHYAPENASKYLIDPNANEFSLPNVEAMANKACAGTSDLVRFLMNN